MARSLAPLAGAPCAPAHVQSEFLGETFPYKAFSTLPTTPIAIGGATLNVGFAPMSGRLDQLIEPCHSLFQPQRSDPCRNPLHFLGHRLERRARRGDFGQVRVRALRLSGRSVGTHLECHRQAARKQAGLDEFGS